MHVHKPTVDAIHSRPAGARAGRCHAPARWLLPRLVALFWLVLVVCGEVLANGKTVWVALSETGEPYAEIGRVLVERLPGLDVQVGHWGGFDAAAPAPALIVTVGSRALREVADDPYRRWPRVPVVATLVSRNQIDRLAGMENRLITGVYLDPPFERQFALLRLARPEWKRVGVMLGPDSLVYREEIERAARVAGVGLVLREVDVAERLAGALQGVLGADVLLAVPDSLIYSPRTVQHILLASYRRNVPVLAFSAAFVRAGALFALHATPESLASHAASLVSAVLAGRRPAPQPAREYEVAVNANVGRSLGIQLNPDALTRALRSERGRP